PIVLLAFSYALIRKLLSPSSSRSSAISPSAAATSALFIPALLKAHYGGQDDNTFPAVSVTTSCNDPRALSMKEIPNVSPIHRQPASQTRHQREDTEPQ